MLNGHESLPLQGMVQLLKQKGWTSKHLSQRWGLTKRRVDQLFRDDARAEFFNDAFRSLPDLSKCENPDAEHATLTLLRADAYERELEQRGWSFAALAERWGRTRRRIDQLVKDAQRPRYFDDALRGLPVLDWAPMSLPGDLSKGEIALIERLKRSPLPACLKSNGWAPLRYPQGVSRADYLSLIERRPSPLIIAESLLMLDAGWLRKSP